MIYSCMGPPMLWQVFARIAMSKSIRLPPLNSLRVFDAVMSYGSFRKASSKLLVSPQAISQQIQLLKDNLQVSYLSEKYLLLSLQNKLNYFLFLFNPGLMNSTKV
ncbi:hypothetical protein BA893_24060 [Vibrio natriegens]|uniref:LysR family transcriptional regulator n=1 Tax=Vibrio natriegens TaxID=691 RepID=UPI000803DBF4|nr:hypothetical protein BA893_24060 [Vibrio natriegens]